MLHIELPMTYSPMKLSSRFAGPNADGAAFNGFMYSTLRSLLLWTCQLYVSICCPA